MDNMKTGMDLASQKKAEEDGKEEEKSKSKKLGGIRTMPFILANEICDRFAASGFHSNMITYLTRELNMPLVQASNILTNFGGTASFTPLIGALIADSFAGRFWTIIVGSVIYELVSLSLFLVCYLLEDCAISYEFIQLITHCPVSCCRAWLASPYRQCYHRSVPRPISVHGRLVHSDQYK
ncbi:hypothetical protein QQP08_012210 [Theobroma cacao]|nr:hypothetical protein QQP08_012210 [Theobroma cacao]